MVVFEPLEQQIAQAIRRYEQPGGPPTDTPDRPDSPDPLAFALGWAVAGAVVAARFADAAIDALPIYEPGHGWTQFLLTRRLSGPRFASEPADSFGRLLLAGPGAPVWAGPGGETLALGPLLRAGPEPAIGALLERLPAPPLPAAARDAVWERRSRVYPTLFAATAALVLRHPGLVAARELFVGDEPHKGAYHPLYLHGIVQRPRMVYDWLMLQQGDRAVFAHAVTGQAIYETGRATWAVAADPLPAEEPAAMAELLAGWLRIGG